MLVDYYSIIMDERYYRTSSGQFKNWDSHNGASRSQVWNRIRKCGPILTTRLRYEGFKYLKFFIKFLQLFVLFCIFYLKGISLLICQVFKRNRELFPLFKCTTFVMKNIYKIITLLLVSLCSLLVTLERFYGL